MKRIFSIIFLTIFGFVTEVWADNISIEDVKLRPGGEKTVNINLINSVANYAAFQMDIYMPEGLSIDKSKTTLARTEIGGSFTIGKQKDGAFRLVYSSLNLTPITGMDGTLVNLCIKASDDYTGGTVYVKNITFGTTDSKTVKINDVFFEVGKVALMVTGDVVKMKYGDAVPELTYHINDNNVKGSPVLTCEASSTSPVGSYPIKVSQGTLDTDYVECIDGTLIIEKAPLTISAGNYTKKQGDAMPVFKAAYAGFKNGETETVLTKQPVFSTTVTEASAPGDYPVTVSGAEAQNYDISYEQGTLTVTQADAVVITAESYMRWYGSNNPTTFEYDVQGAALDGVPEITCEATKDSPVGTYAIVVKRGTVKNYNVTFENGILVIAKTPLTISAGNYTMKQGEAMPTFKATYGGYGFQNGETEDVLTKKPVFSTTATETSAPGVYPVTVSGAEAQNYDISYEQGTLTVTEHSVVSVRNYTRQYGDDNPTFEYDVQGTTLDGVPEIICEATKNSPVGTYAIVVKQGTVKNNDVSFINGTLTVEKSPLAISAGNYTMARGESMPVFKAIYSGFKNGETEDVLTKKPVFSTTANKNSEIGEYPVHVSGAEAQNYELTYVQGVLLVIESKRPQSIVWSQEIIAKVGSTVEMEATATSGMPVRYSTFKPVVGSAFHKPEIDGNKIKFPEEGNYMIIAIQDGNDEYEMAADTIQVNVLSDDNGLMCIDGIYYKYNDASQSALKVVKGYKPYMGKIEIPATANGLPVVCVDGFSLYASNFLTELVIGDNVTDCGAQFAGACPNLRVVTLPSNNIVEFDARYPFNCDGKIEEIHCRSQIPYKADGDTFNSFVDYTTCVLYVPTGTKQAYQEAQEWCKFVNIVEEDVPSGIGNVQVCGDSLSWYTLQGIKLPAKPVAVGIYIHGGKKVIVK